MQAAPPEEAHPAGTPLAGALLALGWLLLSLGALLPLLAVALLAHGRFAPGATMATFIDAALAGVAHFWPPALAAAVAAGILATAIGLAVAVLGWLAGRRLAPGSGVGAAWWGLLLALAAGQVVPQGSFGSAGGIAQAALGLTPTAAMLVTRSLRRFAPSLRPAAAQTGIGPLATLGIIAGPGLLPGVLAAFWMVFLTVLNAGVVLLEMAPAGSRLGWGDLPLFGDLLLFLLVATLAQSARKLLRRHRARLSHRLPVPSGVTQAG